MASSYWLTGYVHLEFLRTSDDGERDVYKLFDYNTSTRRPELITEGTLTVDTDGNGYMEAQGCFGCSWSWGGEVTFSSPYRFSATLNDFSPSGQKSSRDVGISFRRRQ